MGRDETTNAKSRRRGGKSRENNVGAGGFGEMGSVIRLAIRKDV